MSDEFDLNDIMLEATAEVQEIMRELMQELGQPRNLREIEQAWATAPDEMKDQFASDRPDDAAAMTKAIEERM